MNKEIENDVINGTEHIDFLIDDFKEVEKQERAEQRSLELLEKQGFKSLFYSIGGVVNAVKPLPTLDTLSADNPICENALDALYETFMDVPQMHWILSPGNEWAQRGFTIGMFAIPFYFGLVRDIKETKKPKEISKPVEKRAVEQNVSAAETTIINDNITMGNDDIIIDLSEFNGVKQ